MDGRLLLILLLVLSASTLVAACSEDQNHQAPAEAAGEKSASADAKVPLDGKSLVEQRCIGCHGLDEVYGHKHTREEWKKVIDNMVARGARLDDSERKLVLDYLSSR